MQTISAMISDRRKSRKLPRDSVEKILNREQLSALLQGQQFGWRLWFIRKPFFPDTLPVLYNITQGASGILEPDGHINSDVRLKVRSEIYAQSDPYVMLEVAEPSERFSRNERRKNQPTLKEGVEKFLNPHQLRALRDNESSGWRLLFVRTSLFQAAVVVIVSSEGDVFATLEHDGQVNMTPDLSLRGIDLPIATRQAS